jgi:autotransporter-associated beta strand protein
MTNRSIAAVAGNSQRLRARLLLSACAVLVPGAAYGQTVTAPNSPSQTISGSATLTVNSGASIVTTGSRGVNYNGEPAGAGPTINNDGTIQSNNAAGYGVDTQNTTTTGRSITINNRLSTSVIQGTEGGIRIRNGAGADLSVGASTLVTVTNAGRITGGTGGGINLGSIPNSRFLITNSAGGLITGATGIFISQGTLTNSGTVTGTAGWGVDTQNTGTGRAVTIVNNANATIGGSEGGIRIRNGAGQDTTGVTSANLVTITNRGTIQGGTDQGINLVGIPATQLSITNIAGATIRGSSGILAASGTIDNYGLITGTALAASGTTYGANNGEAIRLNGSSTSAASVITLYGGSTTTGTGSGANAIHVSAGTSTTVNVRSGATVNGDISLDSRIGIVNLDSGAVLNGNVDTDPGEMTVNLQTGATVTGQINGGAAATGFFDTLNLSGTGAATLPVVTAFDRINVLSGDWTLVDTAFATAQGIAIASGATVRYGNGGAAGALSGAVENNGAIVYNRTDTLAPGAAISGSGTVTIVGTGTLALQVANSYTGATVINDGRLRGDAANVFAPGSAVTIGAAGTLDLNDTAQTIASLAGSGRVATGTVTGGVLTTDGTTDFSGTVVGLGGIAKTGTGTLTLSGANSATGTFSVSGGALLVTGSLAGGAAALAGGTLGGSGTIAGAISVADGATLTPGAGGAGTLTTGGLTLASGAALAFDLGAPGTAGASDRITVNGDLVLDGTLNITDVGGFGYGVYRLIDYSGALTDNGLAIGTTPAGTNAGLLSVQTLIGQQVNLVYGSSAVSAIQFWDGADTAPDGAIDGGSGSWTNTLTNWTSSDGTGNAAWGGNFAVFQGAPGTVTVDDAIGFGGMQFITSGYVIAAGTGTLSASEALTNLRADPGVTATIAAAIGGSGGLVKNDAGTVILAAANSYAGATTVNGGTLRLAAASAAPASSAVTVASGATLDVAASQAVGSLAGAGAVTLTGGSLSAGALNSDTAFSGVISGSGGVTKTGTGTLTLSGGNSWTGATSVAGGTLALATGGQIGSGALDVAAGATANLNGIATSVGALSGAGRITIGTDGSLTTTNTADTSFTGALTGTRAALTKAGAGTLTLSGANSFSGGLTVDAGRLLLANATALSNSGGVRVNAGGTFEIAADKTVGALSGGGRIVLGGNRLTSSSAQAVEFAGVIEGSGGLTKAGSGTLTLSGANLYTGTTAVTAGTLLLTGSVAGDASVASGGTLAGTGSVAGTLSVADGTVSAGNGGVGTLSVGGLTLGATSVLAYDLGAPGTPGASDRIQVNGALVLDGTLNASDAGGFGQGVYRLIDYSGTLTDNGLIVGTLPNGFTAGQGQVQTSVAGQVNLVVGGALPDIQFWDGSDAPNNGRIGGGSGSWNTSTINWTNAAADFNAPWGGRFAVFQGTGGTVTVDGAIAFTGMQFTAGGYTIAAGTGTLSATGNAAIRVDPGVSATIARGIGGSGGIEKLDSGTLILAGTSSYTGATTVSGGTLRAATAGALSGASAVTVASGATLDVAAAQTIASLAGAGSVTLSGGDLTTGGNGSSTRFDGVLSGSGGLVKTGAGTFTLGGANSYAGGTSVAAGTLQLVSGGNIGSGALSVAAGATLDLNGVAASTGALSGAGTITLGSATLSTSGSASTTFSGVISGSGGLVKGGTGTLTLSGANSYSGATRVAGGTLVLAGATALPNTAAVTVDGGATLALGSAKTIASLDGAGAVALGANTLSVSAGTFSGAIGGTGGLIKTGSGTLTLSGTSSYTGLTTVSGGTLALGQGGSIAASSGVTLSASGATLDIGAAQAIGTLNGVAGTAVRLGATLTATNAGTASFAGSFTGTGGFVKAGAGTLTLGAASTHTGGTSATGGILRAGIANAFGPGVLTVATGARADLANFAQAVAGLSGGGSVTLGTATLSVGDASSTSFDGVISGTGGLTKTGSGTLTLAGANSYTGATAVNAGSLIVNGSIASQVTLAAGARLGGGGTLGGLTVSGTLAPGNSIGTLNVAGNLVFAAGSTYAVEINAAGQNDRTNATGTVTINGGTVSVLASAGTYQPQTDYTILTGSSVTGTFGTVTSDAAFLAPTLLYSPSAVTLRMQRNNVSFASIGTTPNQVAVGTALGATQSGTLFQAVIGFDAPTARAAFDTLSGEVHADTLSLANREAQAVARPLLDRLAASEGDGATVWLQGYGARADIDGASDYAGISAGRVGLIGGVEYGAGAARVGLAGGYGTTNADMDARGSDATVKTAQVAVYGGFEAGGLRIGAGAGYLHHQVSTTRTVFVGALTDAPTARYSGDTAHAFGEFGYAIGDAKFAIQPFLGLSYASTKLDGATERGGAAALALGADTLDASVATAGIRFGGNGVLGEGVRLDGMIAARRFLDGNQAVRRASFAGTGQGFAVTGADYGRNGGVARLGFSLPAFGGSLGANLEGDFGKGTRDYGARVSAGWRF